MTPPQKIEGEEEPYIYSFKQDILRNSEVVDLFQVISNNLKTGVSCAQRYFVRYKKYRMVWRTHKDKVRNFRSLRTIVGDGARWYGLVGTFAVVV